MFASAARQVGWKFSLVGQAGPRGERGARFVAVPIPTERRSDIVAGRPCRIRVRRIDFVVRRHVTAAYRSLLVACVAAVLAPASAALAADIGVRAAAGSLGTTVKLPAAKAVPGPEIERLRTRNSQTFAANGGSYEVHVSRESINYRDAHGRWQPIDNSLTADGDVLRNGANRYRLEVPRALGYRAIRVSSGSAWLEFEPRGAAARAAVGRDAKATFAQAWPGVDLRYEASSDSVKEALVVGDRSAIRDFSFDLRVPFGYTLEQRRTGSVLMRDAGGQVRMRLSRSTMIDANRTIHNTRSELTRTEAGWRLTIVPDRQWLDDPRRAWPVVIDPTVSFGAGVDCVQASCDVGCDVGFMGYGTGNNSEYGSCDGTELYSLNVGEAGPPDPFGNNFVRRALVRFDLVDLLPPGAVIEFATIDPGSWGYPTQVYLEDLTVYQMDESWNEDVTGATSDGSAPWTVGGAGDAGDPILPRETDPIYPNEITDMVRRWWNGDDPNHGILFTMPGAVQYSETAMLDPVLVVQYAETDDPEGDLQQTAVEAYMSEVSISAAEALRRLVIQDRFSNLRSDLVDAIEPADFGGTWIDDADGGQVKVGIETNQPTPPSSKTEAARDVLEDHDFVEAVDFVAVASSLADLRSARENLRDDIQGITHGRVAISVDSELNSLVVRKANSLTPAEQSTLANALGALSVDADTVETGLATLIVEEQACDIFNARLVCDRPLRGGVNIRPDVPDNRPWCTAGFFAERNGSNAQVLITAGHCWDVQANEIWHARNAQGESFQIGTFQEHVTNVIDGGLINVPSTSHWYQNRPNPLGWVLQMPSPGRPGRDDYHIRDSAIPRERVHEKTTKWQLVCMTSSVPLATGLYTRCGRFVDESYDAPVGNNVYILDTTITSICGTHSGASGGPYYKNKLAYGIHVGITADVRDEDLRCPSGNALYQKVPHIERELEVEVSDGNQ